MLDPLAQQSFKAQGHTEQRAENRQLVEPRWIYCLASLSSWALACARRGQFLVSSISSACAQRRLCLPHPHRRGPVGAAFAANGRRRLVEGEEVHAGAAGCRCSPSVIAARPPCQYTSMIVLSVNTAISSVVSVASICSGTTHKLGSWNSQTHSNPVTTAKQLPRLTGSSAVTPST